MIIILIIERNNNGDNNNKNNAIILIDNNVIKEMNNNNINAIIINTSKASVKFKSETKSLSRISKTFFFKLKWNNANFVLFSLYTINYDNHNINNRNNNKNNGNNKIIYIIKQMAVVIIDILKYFVQANIENLLYIKLPYSNGNPFWFDILKLYFLTVR